ncbi:helix-turn-helix domain-containing protein [Actinomadura welshii]|uniref:helix-turn-helix domain-containing protein n=1 Tax=Actinomadura welshii TaxID=3103817 RepID=UPI0003AD310A|nr:helix-turn-helix transcriptional regulator [Actinomadura madurae]
MNNEVSPVVQSLLLRNALVRHRKKRGLTQEQVAHELEWSSAKLIRIEGGRSPLSKTDLQVLLAQYGVVEASEVERLQNLARDARRSAWWQAYRHEISDNYLAYIGYEAGASFIRQVQDSAVPGLLQTEDYARMYSSEVFESVDSELVVKFRLRRQDELNHRTRPPRQSFLLDEAVIRRHVGIKVDREIMPTQLRRLVEEGRDGHVEIAVIPFGAGAHPGMKGPFTLLEFDGDLGDILYLEGSGTSETITGEDPRIAAYRAAFEQLRAEALPSEESLTLIEQIADEMSG